MAEKRPSWNEYFMDMAILASSRSTCLRRSVGAVIVKDNRVMATGYNGVPSNVTHCAEVGCLREKLNVPSGQRQEICRGLHAEQNAIIQAAYMGVNISGSVIYSTTKPCSICSKMIINAGIKKIIYAEGYDDPLSEELLKEADVELIHFERE